jgi:hypothetical protein
MTVPSKDATLESTILSWVATKSVTSKDACLDRKKLSLPEFWSIAWNLA